MFHFVHLSNRSAIWDSICLLFGDVSGGSGRRRICTRILLLVFHLQSEFHYCPGIYLNWS